MMLGSALAKVLVSLGMALSLSGLGQSAVEAKPVLWKFDQTGSIGGYPTKIVGHPSVIETPYGKAVAFNGVGDALFVPDHPLAGAQTWTWEVIFRPDGGAAEQRFFHLSVLNSAGQDIADRMLFEIRVVDGQWCLDSFAMANGQERTLLNCQKLHPLGNWYRVTAVYDGTTLRNYVGDDLQDEGDVHLVPQGTGHASIGVRINLKDYFKGAILEARFTPRALPVNEFLKMPKDR
jgi:hypothetical protein